MTKNLIYYHQTNLQQFGRINWTQNTVCAINSRIYLPSVSMVLHMWTN